MPVYYLICASISLIALWILLCAVAINFYLAKKKGKVLKEKRSLVATGAMLAFFIAMYIISALPYFKIKLSLQYDALIRIFGTVIIVFSAGINICGRFFLKANWGNQIRLYEDHTLITKGPFKYVRHPLYASTIAMLIGFGFLQADYLVVLLTIFIFIPMMAYRASQEDKMLLELFKDRYAEYKERTGMFFPKIKGGKNIGKNGKGV